MVPTEQKIYCSLDIETSGFDPLTNEVLEVGFAFFTIGNKGIKITEEWTQVFKPSKAVSPQILGLTGISQQELDDAPLFSEHQKFLQEKLGDAVIVGHNIAFDTKFLEGFGIKFSGKTIDTLDLVQFLLPTHHSYNLENLMHTFGISHKEAHRALADSKATLKLLEKLLQLYSGFPQNLKEEMAVLLRDSKFLWKDLLEHKIQPLALNENRKLPKKISKSSSDFKLKLEPKIVYNFNLDYDFTQNLPSYLEKGKSKILLVVPKAQQLLELFKQGLISKAVFLSEFLFDEKKFRALLKKKDLSPEEIKFLLKILVWQHTNWQTQTILDLNLSFFGGQFKNSISGGKVFGLGVKDNIIGSDHATFLEGSNTKLFKGRHVVICGLNEFEAGVTMDIGTKASWGYITYLVKSFYNFELNSGEEKFMAPAREALAASDLFFGLINALLQTDPPGFQYYKISGQTEYDEKYLKIKSAAENYIEKLLLLNKVFLSKAVEDFAANLKKFFEAEENRVKWIELSETRCSLISMPIDISGLVKESLAPFDKVSFVDALDTQLLPGFFMKRLGLSDFTLITINTAEKNSQKNPKVVQGDLFSGIKKVFGTKKQSVKFHCLPKTPTSDELVKMISSKDSLPAAVLFASQANVREFYEQNYQMLKQQASLLVQSNSGGSNKIFRNFAINPKSLLLATDKFILKHVGNSSLSVDPVSRLSVKTLIICRLPFEQFSHPYQEAISQSLPNSFMDYALPKALFNFQSLIKFFYTPLLENIYVIDAKLSKDYSNVFKDFYKFIPGCGLKP